MKEVNRDRRPIAPRWSARSAAASAFGVIAIAILVASVREAMTLESFNSIPLVTVGGTGGTGTTPIDPAAYQGGGGGSSISVGKGPVVNNTGSEINDLTVSLKKVGTAGGAPTFTSASIGGSSANATGTSSGATAHISGLSLGSGSPPPSFEATLSGINMNGCEGASVTYTSSRKMDVEEEEVEASRLGLYQLSLLADSLRLGIEDVSNSAVFAEVLNVDTTKDIVAIAGEFSPAAGTSTSLVSIHLLHASSGNAVAGASASVDGNGFEISGFSPLPPSSKVLVLARLSQVPGYDRLTRLQVEAAFD